MAVHSTVGSPEHVQFQRCAMMPQLTRLARCSTVYARINSAFGVARNAKEYDVLFSRQRILLNKHPWIVVHDGLFPFFPQPHFPKALYRYLLETAAGDFCRAILSYSHHAAGLISRRNVGEKALETLLLKNRVVYPAVADLPRFAKENVTRDLAAPIHVLFVGTQFFIKAGHLLVDAFEHVKRRFPLRMTVVSSLSINDWTTRRDPELVNQYRDKMRNLGIVHYDKLDNGDVRGLMGTADILALPSIDETFGLVLLEGMASGCATLSTGINAMPEIVENGVTGRIVPHEITSEGRMDRYHGYEDDLRESIKVTLEDMIKDFARLKEMKNAARQRYLSMFTPQRLKAELEETFRIALS